MKKFDILGYNSYCVTVQTYSKVHKGIWQGSGKDLAEIFQGSGRDMAGFKMQFQQIGGTQSS